MRVLIADDQPDVRYAYRVLLGNQPDMEIVGEAIDARELIIKSEDTYPDVVLLDWELPGLSVDGLNHLRQLSQSLIIIALSGCSEVSRAALAVGADAFVSKVEPPERLLMVISETGCFARKSTEILLPSKVSS